MLSNNLAHCNDNHSCSLIQHSSTIDKEMMTSTDVSVSSMPELIPSRRSGNCKNLSLCRIKFYCIVLLFEFTTNRSLLLYGESDLQTEQLQPITGTPRDDPHPKILTSNIYFTR